jgi:hypothetical protein
MSYSLVVIRLQCDPHYFCQRHLNLCLCSGCHNSSIDLSLPLNGSIDRTSPYDNVLAYNVGNEVANSNVTTVVAPFVKAAARDVKGTLLRPLRITNHPNLAAYLKSKNLPQLVGYAAVDAPDTWRLPLANYLSCGSEADAIDIYGLNN